MAETITVNCTTTNSKSSEKKIWSFEIEDYNPDCVSMTYRANIQEKNNFPEDTKVGVGSVSHMHHMMKPIVYEADESLRELSPEQ